MNRSARQLLLSLSFAVFLLTGSVPALLAWALAPSSNVEDLAKQLEQELLKKHQKEQEVLHGTGQYPPGSLLDRVDKLVKERDLLIVEGKASTRQHEISRETERILTEEQPQSLSQDSIAAYHDALNQSLDTKDPQKLIEWFQVNTALDACRNSAEGHWQDLREHILELFIVLKELKEKDKPAFYKRHDHPSDENMPPKEKTAYEEVTFNRFARDYDDIRRDRELLEILWLTILLHDYGKLVEGNHATNGAILCKPLLERLIKKDERFERKFKFIKLLIQYHVALGGDFFFGFGRNPDLLRDDLTANGITNPQDKKDFFKLLSLFTFCDVGSVDVNDKIGKTGRFVKQNVEQIRLAGEFYPTHFDWLIANWGKLRWLGIYGHPMLPIEEKPLVQHVDDAYAEFSGLDRLPRWGDLVRYTSEDYRSNMVLLWRRFAFGPPRYPQPGGSHELTLRPSNAVKWMALESMLWDRWGDRNNRFTSIGIRDNDTPQPSIQLNGALQPVAIDSMVKTFEIWVDDVARALRSKGKVRLWGVMVSLSDDGSQLIVDLEDIQTDYDQNYPIAIHYPLRQEFPPETHPVDFAA